MVKVKQDSFFVNTIILQISMQHVIEGQAEAVDEGGCIGIWQLESHIKYAVAMPIQWRDRGMSS